MKKFSKLKLIVKDLDSNKDFETSLILRFPYMIINIEKDLKFLHNTEKINFRCVDETKLKVNDLDLPTLSNFVVKRIRIINSLIGKQKDVDKKVLCQLILVKYLGLLRDVDELSLGYLKRDVSYKLFDATIMGTIRTQVNYTIRNFVGYETLYHSCGFTVVKLVESDRHKKNLDIYDCFEDPIRNFQECIDILKADINKSH